ncbi:oxidoreductase [Oceanococcus atlanticus]|uniref:Oxidoreductase n=1 Tax=Oceanococcus atlanticus TaxID=1317117 RepID=A0A1Y1SIC6_9GAMM|nr:NAD(P)H-binding protein [Oceanococcus atlanticus]ORE89061.1 oxidoreductase [Oceanococcus atlanticus]
MRVGLIGATGLVGNATLNQLLADDAVNEVRVWARQPAPFAHPRLHWNAVDFDQLRGQARCDGLDAVLCCLGTTTGKAGRAGLVRVDHDYVLAIATAAKSVAVPCFGVISALGASARSPSHYSRVKGRMENSLQALGFPSLEILRPSLLLGERTETRCAEDLAQACAPVLNALLPGPLKRYRAIGADQVARDLIRVAKQAEPGINVRFLPLT